MTRIASGLSTSPDAGEAGREAARDAAAGLRGEQVDLAFLFLSPGHLAGAAEAAAAVREQLGPRHLLGCVAEGVLAGDVELEPGATGAAVWAASLPGAEIETFHLSPEIDMLPDFGEPSLVALLVDPFSFPADAFLAALNAEREGLPLVGGVAVGGRAPGAQALLRDGEVHDGGAIGAVVSGVPVVTAVSQGCAPIGRESVITRAEGNIVYELAGKPAFERLRDELAALPPEQQELAAQGLLAGIVIDENRAEYGRGDYLMRGLLGFDEASGALAVGTQVRVGQTLRFHVRDAVSADEDLSEALAGALGDARAAGALLFTCNGRGTNMFPGPHHDARAVAAATGSGAVAGFFCGGEIGPVGGRAFLHGFTATLALFLDPAA